MTRNGRPRTDSIVSAESWLAVELRNLAFVEHQARQTGDWSRVAEARAAWRMAENALTRARQGRR